MSLQPNFTPRHLSKGHVDKFELRPTPFENERARESGNLIFEGVCFNASMPHLIKWRYPLPTLALMCVLPGASECVHLISFIF